MAECACTRPTNGWLCTVCIQTFINDLDRVDAIMLRLETAKVGDTKPRGNGTSGGTSGSRAPVNLTVTQLMLDLEVLLRALGGHVDRRWLREPGWVGLASVVVDHMGMLARFPYVVQYREQLAWLLEQADRLLNPVAERQLLGPCPEDDTPLTCGEGDPWARCTTCGTTYDVGEYRLNRILAALGDDGTPVRASEAVRRFTAAGLGLTAKTVENWVKYEHIHPVAVDEHQRRLFALTDLYTKFSGTYSP